MNDVGEDGELAALLDVVLAPIVGQLVAGFLPGHALLNPLVAAAMLLPGLAGAVQRKGRIGQLLHALVTHLGQPELDGLCLGAGDGLHNAQQSFCGGTVGEALFSIWQRAFSTVTSFRPMTATFIDQAWRLSLRSGI
ncbi:hypothetical protein [Acidovorax sp.]|uniref:hypothetical protein n=1 Tax=Acidovorax sp. TaxID=1872122 RepID=UPI002ACDCDD9|nr:hypothetical protein [Acidovorax sp.]MDZ7865063.1 hypothetical protein [Acidovorax sp.]